MAKLSDFLVQSQTDETPKKTFELVPDGEYDGTITSSDFVDTKSGGKMFKLVIDLDEGRKIFDNLVVVSTSEKAMQIARTRLSNIVSFNGITDDSLNLEGARVRIVVGTKPAEGQYKAQNIVRFYNDHRLPKRAQNEQPKKVSAPIPQGNVTRIGNQYTGNSLTNMRKDAPTMRSFNRIGNTKAEIAEDEVPF